MDGGKMDADKQKTGSTSANAEPSHAAPSLIPTALSDKYNLDLGRNPQSRIFITGTQAIVRLALMQRMRDEKAGLNTAGFISGYRGSPLGGLDQQLVQAKKALSAFGARGFSRGSIYNQKGELVASVAQEGLIRQRRGG